MNKKENKTENPLHKLMSPKSVAIAGASPNPSKMGTIQFLNLLYSSFSGDVFPVHPKAEEIFGYKAYSLIEELPYAPELAMMVVPTKLIIPMMEKFGEIGVKRAIVISAGFRETGVDGKELEKQVMEIANHYGIRFLGPNCMGMLNTHLPINTTAAPVPKEPGFFSLASQSGTYITQTTGWLNKQGIRFSKGISVGNAASIDLTDALEYLGEDPETKAIGLYIESIRQADRFLEVAKKVTREKPVIAQYVGGTESGARSGASHTGAMAGPDYIYDGLFEQAGIIRVNTVEELYRTGNGLANQPRPKGKRIAILTNSGGPGTAMATTLDMEGMGIGPLPKDVEEKIRDLLPGHASVNNPVDLTFHTDMTLIADTLPDMLLSHEDIDGLLVHGIMDTGWGSLAYPVFHRFFGMKEEQIPEFFFANLDNFVTFPGKYQKPVVVSSFFGQEDHAVRTFQENNIPVVDSPEKAAKIMAALYRYSTIRKREPDTLPPSLPVPDSAKKILSHDGTMDEYQAGEILCAYGIPLAKRILAGTPEEAVEAAEKMGYPVVLKGLDPEIQHKTEKGLVRLGLETKVLVSGAAAEILEKAEKVMVMEMVASDREFMAGMTRFPGFPPIILFGLGGVLTEAVGDFAVRLAPFGRETAFSLIQSISSSRLLGNYRGMPEVNTAKLADILIRLGQLAVNHPEIKEIDINPILIRKGEPVAVDALVVR